MIVVNWVYDLFTNRLVIKIILSSPYSLQGCPHQPSLQTPTATAQEKQEKVEKKPIEKVQTMPSIDMLQALADIGSPRSSSKTYASSVTQDLKVFLGDGWEWMVVSFWVPYQRNLFSQ